LGSFDVDEFTIFVLFSSDDDDDDDDEEGGDGGAEAKARDAMLMRIMFFLQKAFCR
jgi:hypothetical protein